MTRWLCFVWSSLFALFFNKLELVIILYFCNILICLIMIINTYPWQEFQIFVGKSLEHISYLYEKDLDCEQFNMRYLEQKA